MSFVKLLCVCILYVGFANAGFKYGTCPDNPQAVIPCDYDCKTNHAAANGTCTNEYDWNCICEGSGTYYSTCTYLNACVHVPLGCQCATNNPILSSIYAEICDTDCRCTHGGASGTCNWNSHQCICSYPTDFVWQNETCPAYARAAVYDPDREIAKIFDLFGGNFLTLNGLC